ncbi:MAG: acyl-CoA thioesterase [Planctomycetota bacterium]|nr:acyl-CoA thioesterase [Planctomycetota bacterium]
MDTTFFSDVFETQFSVDKNMIDQMNHVNNLHYLDWTNKAAGRHCRYVGWPSERLKERGQGFVVRSHQIQYRQPAMLGDEILVETWIATMEKVSSIRKYRILRVADRQLLARAETNWAFIDRSTMRLARIPPEIQDAFRSQTDSS